MQQVVTRSVSVAASALVVAGAVGATPARAVLPAVVALEFQLVAGGTDMILDLVRHGQSSDNVSDILGTTPPGAPLTDLGEQQAVAVGQSLYNGGDNDIAGIYASEFLRTQQTSWPLDQLLQGNSDYVDIPAGPTPAARPESDTARPERNPRRHIGGATGPSC